MIHTNEQLSGCDPVYDHPDHAGALISQTSRLIRRAMDARIADEVTPELTGVRGFLLGELIAAQQAGHPVYQRDIERWSRLRRSSVTAILQGMEQDGFITRTSVEQDARLKQLLPTPKGVACHDRIKASIDRFEQDLQAGLTRDQIEQMRVVLLQLLQNAQAIAGEKTRQATEERSE